MKHISRSSFTLIEMLIVIVIIGILAAALVPRLQAIQWRARDSERKVDLRTIYTAAQVYYTDVGDFPAAHGLSGACAVDAVCSTLSYGWPNRLLWFTWYMTSYPLNPLNIVVNNSELGWPWFAGNYVYRYWNVKKTIADTFDLTAQLENTRDSDRCGVKQYLVWSFGTWPSLWCWGYSSQLYEYSPDSNSF